MRRFPLDGALLLFDRDSGTNVLCEGEETAELKQVAPRVVQFGITNNCNLACSFCSRDLTANSSWTADEAFEFLRDLANEGVLEVAFGGGEPWVFPGFAKLLCRLYDETSLAVNFTTNGLNLSDELLVEIRGRYGQFRISLYDDNDWRRRVLKFAQFGARFGVNYLVTQDRLREIETTVLELCALGCRDILLLSYNGYDANLHLLPKQSAELALRVNALSQGLAGKCQLKLDVCWGERMEAVPRLFDKADCGAGRDFIVITSDRKLQPCSFHELSIPFSTASEVMDIWRNRQEDLRSASSLPGCARVFDYGFKSLERRV